jgi:hypothetical protein
MKRLVAGDGVQFEHPEREVAKADSFFIGRHRGAGLNSAGNARVSGYVSFFGMRILSTSL